MPKLPAFQFYPGDWLRDSVSGCSLAAQGLWLRMMIVMHDSQRYGYLADNDGPIPPVSIAQRCGCTPPEFDVLLAELTRAGVPSRTETGIIYSRRMVRDAKTRAAGAERQARFRERSNARSNGRVTPLSEDEGEVTGSSSSERAQPDDSPPVFRKLPEQSARLVPHGALQDMDIPAPWEPPCVANENPTRSAFEQFQSAYPKGRKFGGSEKVQAWREWIANVKTEEDAAKVLSGLEKWKACDEWSRGFAPAALTFLRRCQWTEDPPDPQMAAPAPQSFRDRDAASDQERVRDAKLARLRRDEERRQQADAALAASKRGKP